MITTDNPVKESPRQKIEKQYTDLVHLEYELCSRRYYSFFKRAWEVIEPQTKLLSNWHQELIAEYMTACYLRQIKKLIINIPPRYTKSNLVTVAFPTWVWTQKPDERFLFTSYSASLSTKHSVDRRTIIESAWYQEGWGRKFKMASDQNVKTEFQNDKRGHMVATSMGGTATGKGGNILIVDDPHNPKRAESQLLRESAIQDFDQSFTTRLDDKVNGVIIIVMQRLHEGDLTGHLLSKGGYTHLCLPAEAPQRTVVTFPVSGKEIVREEGAVLHPEREDKAALDKGPRLDLGSYGYANQYQQESSPREGGIFKRSYWKRYDKLFTKKVKQEGQDQEVEVLDYDEIVGFWDMSFKDLTTSDFVCGQTWGRKGANCYLLHQVKKQMGFSESLKAVRAMRDRYPEMRRTVIEDKANGPAIIESAKNEISGLIAFNPEGSKEERAAASEPMLEAGNVFLPEKSVATFDVEGYIENFAKFPKVVHDDDIDATTMALLYFKARERRQQRIL